MAVTRVAARRALLVLPCARTAAVICVLLPSLLKMFLSVVYARCSQSQWRWQFACFEIQPRVPWNAKSAAQIRGQLVESPSRVTVHCHRFRTVSHYDSNFLQCKFIGENSRFCCHNSSCTLISVLCLLMCLGRENFTENYFGCVSSHRN